IDANHVFRVDSVLDRALIEIGGMVDLRDGVALASEHAAALVWRFPPGVGDHLVGAALGDGECSVGHSQATTFIVPAAPDVTSPITEPSTSLALRPASRRFSLPSTTAMSKPPEVWGS